MDTIKRTMSFSYRKCILPFRTKNVIVYVRSTMLVFPLMEQMLVRTRRFHNRIYFPPNFIPKLVFFLVEKKHKTTKIMTSICTIIC